MGTGIRVVRHDDDLSDRIKAFGWYFKIIEALGMKSHHFTSHSTRK